MCPSEFAAQEMKDKLPGTGDEQTGSWPFPALPCLPGHFPKYFAPKAPPHRCAGSCLIQLGVPTLILSFLICNIGINVGLGAQPLPGAALGSAPCDPSTSRGCSYLHREEGKKNYFPALPNVLGSANLPCQPRLGWEEEPLKSHLQHKSSAE